MNKYFFMGLAFYSSIALADSPLYIPNFFNEPTTSSLETFILGRNCFSMSASSMGLSCNPAHLANEDKHLLRANLNFDSDAKDVMHYAADLRSDDEFAIIRRAQRQYEPLVSRAASNLWYQREWWALKWTPMRAAAALQTRNPAYPEVSMHLLRETELMAQAGFFVADDKNIQVGFQARYVRTEFLRDRFAVLDALADLDSVQIAKTKAVFLEPAAAFTFDNEWHPRISGMISNIEAYRGGYNLNTANILDLGFSTTPDFWAGRVTSAINYTSRSDIDRFADRLSLGTNIQFSSKVAVQVGVGGLSQAVGVTSRIDSLILGLGYKSEDIALESWRDRRLQQVLFELGLGF